MPDRILIVTPAPAGSRGGNRITAERWARLLRTSGYRVGVAGEYRGQPCDVLVALHARKSAASIARFHRAQPDKPLVVVLTGTDLYRDLSHSAAAGRSLERATRLVVLQPDAIPYLPPAVRPKTRVIVQSAEGARRAVRPDESVFVVCVSGHLRAVKDPFRAALAARLLPGESRIRVTHIGRPLTDAMRRRAEAEARRNPRYRWLGEVPHGRARAILARSRLLVLSSRLEGGANVVSEALALGVPVLSSRVSGSVGLLGDGYPGFFPVGGTRELAGLLWRCETDAAFYADLKDRCGQLAWLIDPARERQAWCELLGELAAVSEAP
ncbi:MAG TPA: selenoneine biosynthesis selenosugar synthase SenB [Planctomycetaceae bacterium]|nr:selenoneine biosynthesis selenosugar synthase SenB [Planctomycetaceae bacterium]